MESWKSFLRRHLGDPVPFDATWDFLSRNPNPYTERYIPYKRTCEGYETWYRKNGFYIATDHKTIRDRLFLFHYHGVGAEVFSKNTFAPLKEIRQLIEAISDPSLFPCCIGLEWAQDIVEEALKEL